MPRNPNLNLDLTPLDWSEVLRQMQSFATSGSAKMEIAKLQSLPSATEAKLSIDHIFDATELLQTGSRPFMESLDLFEPWYTRIKKKSRASRHRDQGCAQLLS